MTFLMVAGIMSHAASERDSLEQLPGGTPSGQPSPVASEPIQVEGDKYQGLRDLSASAREEYSKIHRQSMPEIDRLLKTRRCQIDRIGGLLNRTLEKLNVWAETETAYWAKWGESEEVRVNQGRKTLAIMETDRQQTKELIETETQDREELLRKKANLEKYGKRSQDVIQQVDALVQQIRDSEARLTIAQQKFDDLTVRAKNMDTLITAGLVQIRQAKAEVETMVLQKKSEYEGLRTEAQDICNTKKPTARKSSSGK